MGALILFGLTESLIAKLASRACEEACQVLGVYQDLQQFTQTLSYIKSVLLDAEQKKKQLACDGYELWNWLSLLEVVLSDAEYVFDEVEFENLRKKVIKDNGGRIITKVDHFFSCSNPLVFRLRMARKIKEINKRLDKIAADRIKFGLQPIVPNDTHLAHRGEMTYSRVINSEVIGREHDKKKIIDLLVQHDNDKNLSVIPIVGLGGLGKTTLAKFVFNDDKIGEYFSSKMWVCAADFYVNSFEIKELIIKIINSANDSPKGDAPAYQQNYRDLDIEQLQNHLIKKLNGQKFLLIIDDVWVIDRVKWTQVRDLIQVGALGSKILVTTRSQSTASVMGTVSPHILEGLCPEDSLSLFVKWAFKEGEERRYPHLVNIGREIVKKCGGNPLAVRTVGGLLFSKYETGYWENVRDNEIWNLPGTDGILSALKLNYDQMPSDMKKCFAALSLYPKGHAFDSFHVTSLWRALGFLPAPNQNQNQTLKYSANHYLFELLSISFLQDFVDYGIGFAFKIHDLVHDLARSVARNFSNAHHQSFPNNLLLDEFPFQTFKYVKSILFPTAGIGPNSRAFLNACMSSCKHLRFFDLSDSTYETLPRSFGNLKHLRYLSLENNRNIKKLPDSICNLLMLEFFILSGCTELEALPKGLKNLISLQHLEITTKQCVLPEDEISNLSSLRTLRIEFCNNLESLFRKIKLPALKVLCVANCKKLKSLPLDIEHVPALETLLVDNCDMLEFSEGHEGQDSNMRLKVLTIVSMPQLIKLPHWLRGSVNTLQYLSISSCNNLVVLPQWLSTMNCLKTICITGCPNIMSLPNDIDCLPTLEQIEIDGYYPKLLRNCQLEGGESSHAHNVVDETDEIEELE